MVPTSIDENPFGALKPAHGSFALLGLWLFLGIAATLSETAVLLWQGSALFFLLSAFYDAWQLRFQTSPHIERIVPSSLSLGVWVAVRLEIKRQQDQACRLQVFDDYPQPAELEGMPQHLKIPAQGRVEVNYRIRPSLRGAFSFKGTHVLLNSPWHLWQQQRFIPLETPIRVYPNFAAVTKYALLASENQLGQLGIRKLQRRGEGLDFHQLREYRSGDTLRQIDWNATARTRKLISKEYQDERDQRIIFLLDCGRSMYTRDGELSHFDHALNAVLLLAYVALRQGDAIGFMTFSGNEYRHLAPRKGINNIKTVLNSLYDLQPAPHASDYLQAAQELIHYESKRALVIIVSNLRDEESGELLPALKLLRKKHLVLFAGLQEKILNQVLKQPVNSFDDALRYAATEVYLKNRREAHEALTGHGILSLNCEPQQLPVELVNRYLEIKRSGRL